MRMLLASVLVVALATGAVLAAEGEKPAAKAGAGKKAPAAKSTYACSMCKVANHKGGKCPACGMDMEKVKAFACPKCMAQADKAGNCGKCKVALKPAKDVMKEKMTQCPGCKNWMEKGKAKACPVCAKAKEGKAKKKSS